MSSVVQNILENVIGDGARATKFDCMINFNGTGLFAAENDIYALVKTSQFPGKSHDVIDLKFKGRTIPIKGQTKYDNTWTCTFYMTQDHALKVAFENWIESLDQVHNIKRVDSDVYMAQQSNNSGYAGMMHIAQMNFHGDQQCVLYTLNHCFPKSVSAVDVDYSDVGKITEFTVEFSYAYYDTYVTRSQNGNFVDDLVKKAKSGLNDVAGLIKGAMASLISEAKGAIMGAFSGGDLGGAISGAIDDIGGSLLGALGGIGGYLSDLGDSLSLGISSDDMASSFSSLESNIIGTISSAVGSIKSKII